MKSLEIHEMIRLVQVHGPLADSLPDFLCNDVPDLNDFPDTSHASDGSILPVGLVTQATTTAPVTDAQLTTQLHASIPAAGWSYVRVPDPGNGRYALTSVVREDGLVLPAGQNAWITDRTFVGLGQETEIRALSPPDRQRRPWALHPYFHPGHA